MTHELKILPQYYKDIVLGHKTFEIRKNDRDYKVGDWLVLKEWDGEKFTGNQVERYVSYVIDSYDFEGVKDGYCVIGIRRNAPTACLDEERRINVSKQVGIHSREV